MVRKTVKVDNRWHNRRSTRHSASVRKAKETPSANAMPTTQSGAKQPSGPFWEPKTSEKGTLLVRLANGEKKSVRNAYARSEHSAGGQPAVNLMRTLHEHELRGSRWRTLALYERC